MRRHFAALCCFIMLGLEQTDARAGAAFLQNYSAWQGLSVAEKNGYVMGGSDFWGSVRGADDGQEAVSYREGYEACTVRLQITSAMLVTLIDKQYDDPANWGVPPYGALLQGLNALCRTDYNAARAKRGLPPLE